MIKKLFSRSWVELSGRFGRIIKDIEYPGVYLLAYTRKNLTGRKIKHSEIFYVGMSNSRGGVKSRMNQFRQAIEKGYGHSGGDRFFKKYLKKKPFSKTKTRKKFYIASVNLRCDVNKDSRTPKDLRIMGKVAMLEYVVLAHIKQRTGHEPELNKR